MNWPNRSTLLQEKNLFQSVSNSSFTPKAAAVVSGLLHIFSDHFLCIRKECPLAPGKGIDIQFAAQCHCWTISTPFSPKDLNDFGRFWEPTLCTRQLAAFLLHFTHWVFNLPAYRLPVHLTPVLVLGNFDTHIRGLIVLRSVRNWSPRPHRITQRPALSALTWQH